MTIDELITAIQELTTTSSLGRKIPRPLGVVRPQRKKRSDESKLDRQMIARFTKHGRKDKKSNESVTRSGEQYAELMSYYAHQIALSSGDDCTCDVCLGLSELNHVQQSSP